jgi:hypothetical protein
MLAPKTRKTARLLTTSTVLIRDGVILPETLGLDFDTYGYNWRVVTTRPELLDAKITAAGWNFFFTVGKLEASALGSLTPPTLGRALRRILRQVHELHFNAVQITAIHSRHWFGIPSIRIAAHARHIQKGEQLATDQQRKTAQDQSTWAVG